MIINKATSLRIYTCDCNTTNEFKSVFGNLLNASDSGDDVNIRLGFSIPNDGLLSTIQIFLA